MSRINCQENNARAMSETFGEYIHELRVANNLTLTKLAAALDIDQSTLSKIENNKRSVSEEIIPKLAALFNLNEEALQEEFYSEMIAEILYLKPNSSRVLKLAEEKIKYLKTKRAKQGKISF